MFLFLMQVLIVLALARVLGELCRRFKQPPLAGEILAGIVLGETVFGQLSPELFAQLFPGDELQRAMFSVTAELGILLLLLVIGFEINVSSAWKMRKRTFVVATSGVAIPLALGTAAAWVFYEDWAELPVERLPFALLVGAGVAITAITVVARLLFDLKILKSDLGLFLVSAMALNELMGWVVLAVVLGLVGASANADGASAVGLLGTLGAIIVVAAFATTAGRWLTTRTFLWMTRIGLPTPSAPLSLVVCLGLLGGVVTSALGVHPVFGFLLAGMMAGDPVGLSEHTRLVIAQMVEAVFVPLFFAGICLHVDFSSHFDLSMVVLVTLISVGGKFGGAWVGAVLARAPKAEQVAIGIAHIPGGPMGVLLASVAKEAEIIGPKMFVALVVASIASALLVGPAFAAAIRHRERKQALRIGQAFGAAQIVTPLLAEDPTQAVHELALKAAEFPRMPPSSTISETALARERIMGTGLGNSVAIPHARIAGLDRTLVVLGISKDGIDWNASDDKPVHLVFLVMTPGDDADAQLDILKTIAKALVEPAARRSLVDAEDGTAVWAKLEPLLSLSQ